MREYDFGSMLAQQFKAFSELPFGQLAEQFNAISGHRLAEQFNAISGQRLAEHFNAISGQRLAEQFRAISELPTQPLAEQLKGVADFGHTIADQWGFSDQLRGIGGVIIEAAQSDIEAGLDAGDGGPADDKWFLSITPSDITFLWVSLSATLAMILVSMHNSADELTRAGVESFVGFLTIPALLLSFKPGNK